MDSESFISRDRSDGAPPPAYSESSYSTYTSTSTSQYYSSQIQQQLSSLTTQVSSVHMQRELLSHAQDEKILSLLTSDIQIYLCDFAKSGMQRGTLILIPARGIEDENALPADYDFMEAGGFDRVVRVKDKESDSLGGTQTWYWRNEDMAHRLARCLRPPSDPTAIELPLRNVEPKPKVESSSNRGFWGWKRGKKESPLVPLTSNVSKSDISGSKKGQKDDGDNISMKINAEEVVFRTESDMGILGTERGYAIVVKLKVVLAK
jgi:hypothetical protein